MTNGVERMQTGIAGLDHLLEGGLVRGNSLLIEGPPGCGKTTFAMRIAYEGIVQFDEPALVISFEEFPRQIYEESRGFGIDLQALEESGKLRVIWTPPARILEGFSGKNDLIDTVVREMGVRRLVIDSVTHFKRVKDAEMEMRELMTELLGYLKVRGINSILIKEIDCEDSKAISFEEYLVDASIRLHNSHVSGITRRSLQIRKTRGQGHVSGQHTFQFGTEGVVVYPRLRPMDVTAPLDAECSVFSEGRVSIGVDGLDDMLRGGLLPDSVNLVSGYPGTGKTILGLHFLDYGLRNGEPCTAVTLSQSAQRLLVLAGSLGMDWAEPYERGQLQIVSFHPVGLCVDEMMNTLLDQVRTARPARLVFDSIERLWSSLKDKDLMRDYMMVLGTMLREGAPTSLVLDDSIEMTGGGESHEYAYLADCVLRLSIAETEGRLRRFVGVFKHAGSDHSKEMREMWIDSLGLHVGTSDPRVSGILSGQATMNQAVGAEVLEALQQVSSVFDQLSSLVYRDEQTTDRIEHGELQLGVLDVLLREHFGLSQHRKRLAPAE